jgi:hypothetical protein
MRHETQVDTSKHDELAKANKYGVAVAAMPSREQALIDSLKDIDLSWQIKSAKDHRSWESSGVDPYAPNPDPLNEGLFSNHFRLLPDRSFSGRRFPHSTGIDWHTVETETLSTENDLYTISFRRTHINSYMHHLRRGVNEISYTAEFVDRSDASHKVVVDSAQFPELGTLFSLISKSVQ